MWEKEKSHIGLKILLVLLAAGMIFGLVKAYLYVKEQNEAQDAALIAEYNQQQELSETTTVQQASLDTLSAEYQKDLDCVAEYLPGIVCWGDTLTAGSAGNVSFPYVLQDLLDEAINDKYDFKSTFTNATNYTGVDWDSYTVDIPVVNLGSGEESTKTILGRSGVANYVLSKDLIVPAECEAVSISFTAPDGSAVEPLTQGDVGINPVTIGGIEGRLTLDVESKTTAYLFTRSEPGTGLTLPAGTEIVPADAELYKDYIPVIFIGTYGGYDTVQELVAQQKQLIDRQIGNHDRYIVVGLYYFSRLSYVSGGYLSEFEKYEAAMLQEYGSHFINLRKYLISDGLTDAGLSATKDDTSEITSGRVPPSLKSTAKGAELNASGYRLLGQLVYDRMDKLGYFDEVKDELGITALEKLEKKTS